MSKVAIKLSTLTDIGNAVRAKKGTADQIPVTNLADEIQSIQGGTDTSADTVTAESMLEGVTAHNASGEPIVGVIPLYDGAVTGGLSVMANASKYLYGRVATADETPTHTIDGVGYVGAILPNIDTVWDKETYPYALVIKNGFPIDGLDSFICMSSSCYAVYENNANFMYYTESGNGKGFLLANKQEVADEYGLPFGEWFEQETIPFEKDESNGLSSYYVWTSHDIFTTDGTLCLKATEPIPIYE